MGVTLGENAFEFIKKITLYLFTITLNGDLSI